MIRCQGMCLSYLPQTPVLRNISMHLEAGSFTFLSGPSGAGKSSLLGLLALALKPTEGVLELFGRDVTALSHSELPLLRRKIGTVFQDYQLLNHMNVIDNVGLPLKVRGEAEASIREKAMELLEWVGLEECATLRPPLLSGGQKQRVAIARAVIGKPDVILADEPTGNLDPELSMRFMYLFEALNKNGTTIIFATHDANLMSYFNYPVLYLRDGQVQRSPQRVAARR